MVEICKNLLSLLGSNLEFESVVNCGSIFKFELLVECSLQKRKSFSISNMYSLPKNVYIHANSRVNQCLQRMLKEVGIENVDSYSAVNATKLQQSDIIITTSTTPISATCRVIYVTPQHSFKPFTAVDSADYLSMPLKFRNVISKIVGNSNIRKDTSSAPLPTPKKEHKVLIVDDNIVNQKVMAHMLTKLSVQHNIASGGEEALTMATSNTYSLIFMDKMMPDMYILQIFLTLFARDGITAAEKLREKGLKIPIIMVSAKVATPLEIHGYVNAGITSYMTKPVNFEQLTQVVKKHLT